MKSEQILEVIAKAAIELGWQIVVEKEEKDIRGLIIGTDEYVESVLKEKDEPSQPKKPKKFYSLS